MKAILEIEMPSCCNECPLHKFAQGDYCQPTKKLIDYLDEVQEWCPLKPSNKKEISIEWLHKELVDLMYNGELSSNIMDIFHKIIAKWERENG